MPTTCSESPRMLFSAAYADNQVLLTAILPTLGSLSTSIYSARGADFKLEAGGLTFDREGFSKHCMSPVPLMPPTQVQIHKTLPLYPPHVIDLSGLGLSRIQGPCTKR